MNINPIQAIDIIIKSIEKNDFEIIPIENAINRIIAEDIYAKYCLPRFDNSAMDGYAISFYDKDYNLDIIDTIYAGDNNNTLLKSQTCIKIMTGAKIPSNANCIIPKEDVQVINNTITIKTNIKINQHIRFSSEDIKTGTLLIQKDEEINFSKITLLASQGISHIKVYTKPNVVVFSSGNELKLHYENIKDYQIYNSNTPTLVARCKELACNVSFIGQVDDDIDSIKNSIKNALDADLIITSGGVSVGDADFTKEAFNQLGFQSLFDGIIIKPGKPTVFGKIGKTFILNLPGNPLSSSLIFELFGRIIIQKLLGSKNIYPSFIQTKLKNNLQNKKGRISIIPGYFDGTCFEASENRSAGMVSTLSTANSMMILDEKVQYLKDKQDIKILPITWSFFTQNKKDFLTYE